MNAPSRPVKIFIVAGEESGDQLGYKLMRALRARRSDIVFSGVGGKAMTGEGLTSLFLQDDIAVMGFVPVIRRLPLLLRRISQTAQAAIAENPDVVVIIDSPDFTHRVARIVRKAAPSIPIVDYVSPTVWAWRPGRARKMRAYVDHLLALLPFEPRVHAELGGPSCTYVGHPLIERLGDYRPAQNEPGLREQVPPTLLVLPGSRRSEIARLLPVFGETLAQLVAQYGPVKAVLPAVDHLADDISRSVESWPVRPEIVRGHENKLRAFRAARAALAASGTVTLELALAGVPTVAAYRVSRLEEEIIKRVVLVSSALLPNIILGEKIVPEFLQDAASPKNLSAALLPLIAGGEQREGQLAAFARIDEIMRLPAGQSPSEKAAEIVLHYVKR